MNQSLQSTLKSLKNLALSHQKFTASLYTQSLSEAPTVPSMALWLLLGWVLLPRLQQDSLQNESSRATTSHKRNEDSNPEASSASIQQDSFQSFNLPESWREIIHAMHLRAPHWTSEREIEKNIHSYLKIWQQRCGISSKLPSKSNASFSSPLQVERNVLMERHWDQLFIGDEEFTLRWVVFVEKDVLKEAPQALKDLVSLHGGPPLPSLSSGKIPPIPLTATPGTALSNGSEFPPPPVQTDASPVSTPGAPPSRNTTSTPTTQATFSLTTALPQAPTIGDPLFIVESLSFSKYTEKAAKRVNDYLTSISTGKWKTYASAPQQIDKDTNTLLYGLCAFRGQWAFMFPNSDTEEEHVFHLLDETHFGKDASGSRKVPMMVRRNTAERYAIHKWTKDLHFRSLTLHFAQSRFSMLLLLPEKNTTQQMELLEQTIFDEQQNTNVIERICSEQQQVILQEVKVPRININFERDLTDVIKNLEVYKIFSSPDEAQLVGLSPQAKISRVLLKCQITVDEEGVLPAPTTLDNPVKGKKKAKKSKKKATGPPDDVFVGDRPFIAIIYNTTLAIPVFVTKFMDPELLDDSAGEGGDGE